MGVMYGWHQSGWGTGMWIGMVFAMVLFWSVVVVGIVLAVRYLRAPRPAVGVPSGAEEALKTRYAQGEIDEDEYKRRLAFLRSEG